MTLKILRHKWHANKYYGLEINIKNTKACRSAEKNEIIGKYTHKLRDAKISDKFQISDYMITDDGKCQM